jgi:hypothetical protein
MKMRNLKLVATIFICAFITLNSCKNGSGDTTNSSSQKSSTELKMELKMLEKNSPTDYLTASGTYRESFWGNKLKINCTITNKATLSSYKDAVVRVTYFSKTETNLGTKDYTLYEVFTPNSTKTVEMKIENYKDVNSVGWEVVKAVAID